ncbi:cobalamin biosynthesis protein [Vulcanisaeta sp. JCM 16161]|uniref:cobalamin biosynthesis protein n=1 Tax=Vulcanisaeta sp. JCM 16161 TaxID=1295372 RepID=UPI0006D1D738|nr:cobalamin biosynthesis protein [Vulcanisaeta sp. JCM 16161]
MITTTSDSLGVTSIEELARRLITKIMNPGLLAKANAELLRGGCISIIGIDSLPNWLRGNYKLGDGCRFRVIIIDKEPQRELDGNNDIYLKRLRLSIGVGLRHGVDLSLVKDAILESIRRLGVGIDRVDVIASVEEYVRKVAEDLGVKFLLIPREAVRELRVVDDCLTPPSNTLLRLGLTGVAEPLALIAGGPTAKLIMRKMAYANSVTIAIAAHE